MKQRARKAGQRLRTELGDFAPGLASDLMPWIVGLARGGDIDDYFCTGRGYPLLEVPCWMGVAFGLSADDPFLDDVVYSSVCGYFFIRLLDDVVDEGSSTATRLLPATAFFHERFQGIYQSHFPPSCPFWRTFRENWILAADCMYRDLVVRAIDLEAFLTISARKTAAAVIPAVAVCEHLGRQDRIDDCQTLCLQLGRMVQMADDLADWAADSSRSRERTPSFLLSEAERRRAPEESIASWTRREGIPWAIGFCRQWAKEALSLRLVSEVPALVEMIEGRMRRSQEEGEILREIIESVLPLERYFPARP